jgi:hypothetical protein
MVITDRKEVVLDHKLAASKARVSLEVKHVLINILKEAIITVYHDFFYRVDFGPGVYPQAHVVSHDLFCSCVLVSDCPSVTAVKLYLHRGIGEAAKSPSPGFFPAVPHYCPVCGAIACFEPKLSSRHRGIGWHCSKHGATHYWLHQGSVHRSTNSEKTVS